MIQTELTYVSAVLLADVNAMLMYTIRSANPALLLQGLHETTQAALPSIHSSICVGGAHHILLQAEQCKQLPPIILKLPVTAMLNSRDRLQLTAQPC